MCTYDKLRLHVSLLASVPWKAAIFDEVDQGGRAVDQSVGRQVLTPYIFSGKRWPITVAT